MGQQGTRFHAMSPSQMVPQSPVGSMMQADLMSSQYSQPPTSYSDSNYQTFQGYSSQQRMAHPQATSPMGMFQNYGQNGSFMGSMGQYGSQNRGMGHQGGMSNQYPTSTSAVNYGNANYYSEVYPSVPPKSPASHQQMPGSGYGMAVGGNGGSYPGSGYAAQSSMSPMQKQMGQSFFSSRSPAASQIHSPPSVTGNYPGQPPTSPMAQPLVGHPRRSSTSPVSPMMPQGMPVYSMPQRQQQYTSTSSATTQSQLQRSCMFAQRLEKMSAQHQYQAQMGSTTTLPGPTSTSSRRPSFPGQQSPLPGKPPLKSPAGSVSPARRSPPLIGKSPPPFKPLRSPPPYQAKKSPPSFQTPTKPVPYSPQGKGDMPKDQSAPGGEQVTSPIKAKKSKVEKSSMQKLEEVAEKVSPHLAEGLSHAVGDAIERKHAKKKSDTKSDESEQENPAAEVKEPIPTSEDLPETKNGKNNAESKDQASEEKKSESTIDEKGGKEKEREEKTDEGKTAIKDSDVNKVDNKKDITVTDKEKVGKLETPQNEKELNQERQQKNSVVEKQAENKIEKVAENAEKVTENKDEKEDEVKNGKQIENENKMKERKSGDNGVDGSKSNEKTELKKDNKTEEENKGVRKTEADKEAKIQPDKNVVDTKAVKSSQSEKSPRREGELSKEANMKATFSKTHVKQSVSISRSGHTPTIQATVIAKGQSAQSNQQVLVAKTAGGQMYLIQGNVLIPVQNITVQQPKGEKGNKVICVNQGQGKSSHVMVGNITPNLSAQKEVANKVPKNRGNIDDDDDDDDLDDEIDDKMEIDLACREKTLLSPTAEMAENDNMQEPNTSTVSIQTDRQIIKTKTGFQRFRNTTETAKTGISPTGNDSNPASRNEKELLRFDDIGESSMDFRKRIGRPPGSKDKNKRRPYMYKKVQPIDHHAPKQKTSTPLPTKSSTSTTLDSKEKDIPETRSHKRPHSINVPTVSKAARNVSKRPKMTPPSLSPTKTLLVQPRGGVDGDAWVCAFCGKPSNHNSLGVLYGPYKAKLSRDISDRECRSPDKVMSPGGRIPELPTDLDGTSVELWIHKDCGVWSQGIYMLGRTLYGLEQAVESAASHVS